MRTILRLVVPADDGVVDQNDALAFQQIAHRIQLEPHAEVAHALLRLDEGAAHIVIADQAEAERNPALRRISEGRRHAGVRHGHDQICRHAGFARKLAAHLVAALLHPAAVDSAVGPGKVHMLENAARLRNAASHIAAGHAVFASPSPVRRAAHRARTWRAADRTRRFPRRRRWCRARPGLLMRPMESGRKPRGSRAAKMRSRVIITIEKAPSTWRSESAMASTSVPALECAISCTMISESLVVWK